MSKSIITLTYVLPDLTSISRKFVLDESFGRQTTETGVLSMHVYQFLLGADSEEYISISTTPLSVQFVFDGLC
jgi:hypothetical protein